MGQSEGVNAAFWKNRRVLVTGHTGFKGSWLCLWLKAMGADVTGYALEPEEDVNLYSLSGAGNGISSVIADIRDRERLEREVAIAEPEIIFHMAAQPLVRRSYDFPSETYEVNVMGTVNILEAVRKAVSGGAGIRAVVNVTTDKCYDNKEWAWGYRENDVLGGYDPYSSSKACSELVTAAYRTSYFGGEGQAGGRPALASARAGNVVGGGDFSPDRLVPDCIRALSAGGKPMIRSPQAVRPWQHVLDPLGGYLLLAQKLVQEGKRYASAWNFGPEPESMISVESVVRKLLDAYGSPGGYDTELNGGPHEALNLQLDIGKSRRVLGWSPRWNVDETLKQTVEWQREWEKGSSMGEVCLRQIGEYMANGRRD